MERENVLWIIICLLLLVILTSSIYRTASDKTIDTADGVGFIVEYDVKGKWIDNLHCTDNWQDLPENIREKPYECLINNFYVKEDYTLIVNCKCYQTELD